jgi:uncharacterized protein (TIGR04255 family)
MCSSMCSVSRPRLLNGPLRQVACELKFPPRPNLADASIEKLSHALDDHYPAYSVEQGVSVQVGPGGLAQQAVVRHRFVDPDGGWAVVVANDLLSLETTSYEDIDHFLERWAWLQDAVQEIIRLKRVARLGLRYVNQLELPDGRTLDVLRAAIDPRLLAPWEVLGVASDAEPVASLHEIRVRRGEADLTMRHGLVSDRVYLLDFDHYREQAQSLAIGDVVSRLREFNEAIAIAFEQSVTTEQWARFEPEAT